ncbi:MAG: glycosyltransferase family 39 protein [Planctomycetota bacterium]
MNGAGAGSPTRGVGPFADRTEPALDSEPAAPGALPRWFWLLPLAVAAAWWPIQPYWASDDYFALHYARDFGNVLADFLGPQYAADDLFFFYRPLITLSLWLEQQVAGSDPFLAHLDNVLVHAASALLVGCLWRRLLDDGPAFAAGLVWALSPMHIGGIAWAVGRTDGTSTVFGLLSMLMLVRWIEGRQRTRLPSLLLMATALLCKETALCLPGLAALLAFAMAGEDGFAARARAALRGAWPHALLLAGYLAWRIGVLGRMGGYDAASFSEPLLMLAGFGRYALDLLDPLHWKLPTEGLPPAITQAWWPPWIGLLPALLALWSCARRGRRQPALLCLGWFALASVPLAGFFLQADNHHNLRYFALAFAGLAGLLVAGGKVAIAVALLVFVPPLVQVRLDQWRADRTSAAMHQKLVQQLADAPPGPWFIAGLPHQDPTSTALQFHFGIDRMLEPPFARGGVQVYAHRPFFRLPGAAVLQDDDDLPIAPPEGTTFLFRGPDLLISVPQKALPALPLQAPAVIDLSVARLFELNRGELVVRLVTPGVRTDALRVTFFTASGYFGATVANHAPAGAADGGLDLLRFFQQAEWAHGRDMIHGLELPTILDRVPEFPVLIEGGTVQNGAFRPTHRARQLLRVRFDRQLPALLRGELGSG